MTTRRFLITIDDNRSDPATVIMRLKQLLKLAGRRFGFRCTSAVLDTETDDCPEPQQQQEATT